MFPGPVEEEKPQFLKPPAALISRNPVLWLRFFGPGAIIASVTVGSGEVLFPSRGGSIFGYRLLWVFLLISLLKWVLAYTSMRHMVLSGGHPLARWTQLPGPRGWLPLIVLFMVALTIPLWFSFLSGVLGTICTWIFGMGSHFAWATVWVLAALILLAIGGYDFLEKAQTVILAITLVCVLIAVAYVRPDWLAVLKGFVPRPLEYPDWVFAELPKLRNRSEWVEILVYASAIGGQSTDYLAYLSFLRDKKWGRSHLAIAGEEEMQATAERVDHPARLWVRAALIDTVVSFTMVVLIAGCFAIMGAVLLRPEQLVPDGVNLLNYQASFLTVLAPWLMPLYKIAVFFAFFGILYGGPELNYRIVYEYLETIPRWAGRVNAKKLRAVVVCYILLGGLAVLWVSGFFPDVDLIDIVTPAGIFTGVLSCGIYCFANVWMDRRFLPRTLRMNALLVVLNVFSGVVFVVAGLKALWDYGQLGAYVLLFAVLFAAVLAAFKLRHYLYGLPEAVAEKA